MEVKEKKKLSLLRELQRLEYILIVQDIDGVCIPLVKDPLKRVINKDYVQAVSKFRNEFAVLTCGEHEGFRGVNRIIERSIGSKKGAKEKGLYLPGLAACGVEYQNKFGESSCQGISEEEKFFLEEIPRTMKKLMYQELNILMPSLDANDLHKEAEKAICDTRFSPAINLNSLFNLVPNQVDMQIKLQKAMESVMAKVMEEAKHKGLEDSFHLHISPNLGRNGKKEIIKYSKSGDIGTTDIQIIINGALKEAGLLVLLNKFFQQVYKRSPFGENYNVRFAPDNVEECVREAINKIPKKFMPTIIGVGDTITSNKSSSERKWLRGGSDRGFLTLIQRLGEEFQTQNKIIFVDSSHGEVERPSSSISLEGITDAEDPLKFDVIMSGGHNEYIEWVINLAKRRYEKFNT
ncbi:MULTISPECIES: glucosylglycerol 3-phosphatase [Prochlorococcus]|uniref:glucosylglycerol 3-phosphatase n=1 Tax=Prochlorococcus TaxID=1218 RepID=UPI000533B82B|nr:MULTISPECIES: glucosylglycerol 3-phosphatase [Prochlorococcus]KGG12592.1 putative glucosylglycerolphosphate phosphatasee [Prochlorococcus sp. MIT 0601]